MTEQIYEIIDEKINLIYTDIIEQRCSDKIRELEQKFQNKKNEEKVKKLRMLLESKDFGTVEDLLMPENYRRWIENAITDTNERVQYLHDFYNMDDEFGGLYL